jgi:hypothetical protein
MAQAQAGMVGTELLHQFLVLALLMLVAVVAELTVERPEELVEPVAVVMV